MRIIFLICYLFICISMIGIIYGIRLHNHVVPAITILMDICVILNLHIIHLRSSILNYGATVMLFMLAIGICAKWLPYVGSDYKPHIIPWLGLLSASIACLFCC